MKRFSKFLENINSKLDLPQPDKSQILLEVSADLNDLFQTYIERGMDETSAQKLTEEKFYLSDASLSQLIEIHQTPFRKIINRISGRVLNTWEGGILAFIISTMTILALRMIITTPFFNHASYFIYPIFVVFLISFILALVKIYRIFLKKDHNIKRIRGGMDLLLILSLVCLFIGVFGYFTELLFSGDYAILLETKLVFILKTTDSNFGDVLKQITEWTIKSSSLMMFSFITSLFSASAWFFILNRIISIEQAEVEFQLNQ